MRKELAALLMQQGMADRIGKLIALVVEAISFIVAVAIHWMLAFLAKALFQASFPLILRTLEFVFAVSFAVVYIQLTYNMVLVFVPLLRGKQGRPVETSATSVGKME